MKSYINFHTHAGCRVCVCVGGGGGGGGGVGGGLGRGNTFLPPKGITIGRKYGVFCVVVVKLLIRPSVLF